MGLISGPRQSGQTTLATDIALDKTPFLTPDDATILRSEIDDPVGFVRGLDRAVIDEIQRAPDLLLAIKSAVDDDRTPGRFLLTGSANLMTIPKVADSLAGRIEVVRLLPLSQAEIFGKKSGFIDRAFSAQKPAADNMIVGEALNARFGEIQKICPQHGLAGCDCRLGDDRNPEIVVTCNIGLRRPSIR